MVHFIKILLAFAVFLSLSAHCVAWELLLEGPAHVRVPKSAASCSAWTGTVASEKQFFSDHFITLTAPKYLENITIEYKITYHSKGQDPLILPMIVAAKEVSIYFNTEINDPNRIPVVTLVGAAIALAQSLGALLWQAGMGDEFRSNPGTKPANSFCKMVFVPIFLAVVALAGALAALFGIALRM